MNLSLDKTIAWIIALVIFVSSFNTSANEITIYKANSKSIDVSTEYVYGANFATEIKTVSIQYFVASDKIHTFELKNKKSLLKELEGSQEKFNSFALEESTYLCHSRDDDEWLMVSIENLAPTCLRYSRVTKNDNSLYFARDWRKTSTNARMVKLFSSLTKVVLEKK